MDFSFFAVQEEECSGGTYRDRESQPSVQQEQEGNRRRLRSSPCAVSQREASVCASVSLQQAAAALHFAPCPFLQGGDREAEIKGSPPQAPE